MDFMDSVKSMTSGSPGRLIFSFALPLMVGNLFQQLYTVADAMIVGQVLGVGAIAAVGAAEWMIWLMQGMIQGFTQGFSIWMAQAFGAGKTDELRRVVANSAVLSAAIAVLMLLCGQLVAAPILHILNTPATVFPEAEIYMRTMFAGIPVVMVYNLLAAILRSLGDGKTPLYAMIFASVLNIALDLLFVIVFHWGVAGAAAATVTAQLASAIFCLARLRSIEMLRLAKTDFVLTPATHGKLLQLGFPMAFQNAVISVGGMIVQSVVNSFGVHFIAGFTATNKLYGMLEVAATSYGFAMTTYTGQNIGAGKQERVRSGYRAAMGIAMLTSLVIMVAMILGGRAILRCFISGDAQTVEDTLAIAYHYLFIMSVCLPILYYLHVTRSCIQGMGNTVLPMVSGIAEFLMRTGAALLLPLLMGQEGIFYAEISAWAGADVVLFFSYRYCMKKQKG
ncbi:MATE efflux family protein [Marvinbryantia formatexigens DSM 14469]|uniref:Probable multidrug resistance protein NorM n=1 Tax=Marvinbryantia formatexigens DSM 14469 TaxID=478749 RepID=C6LJS9_9FIRM|nr:MATE efflux family protein [Marvinbryantia formatexigens DSM 14469]